MPNGHRSTSRGNRPNLNQTYHNQADRPPAEFPAHQGGHGNNLISQRVSQQLNNTVGGYPHQNGNFGQGHFNPNTSYHQPTAPYMVQQHPQQIPYPIPVQAQMMNRPSMGQPAAFYPPMLLAQQQQMVPPMANMQGPPVMVPILYPNVGINPVLPAQVIRPLPVPMYDNMGQPVNQIIHPAQMQQHGTYSIPQVMDTRMSHAPMHHQMQQQMAMHNEHYPRSPSQEMEFEQQRSYNDEPASEIRNSREEDSDEICNEMEEVTSNLLWTINQNKLKTTCGTIADFDGVHTLNLLKALYFSCACVKASHPDWFHYDDPSHRFQYVVDEELEDCKDYTDKADFIFDVVEQLEENLGRLPDPSFSSYDGVDSYKVSKALKIAINFIAERKIDLQSYSEGLNTDRPANCSNPQQMVTHVSQPKSPSVALSHHSDQLPQSSLSAKSQESDPSSKSHNESTTDKDKRATVMEMTSLGLSIYHKIISNKKRSTTTTANSDFDNVDSSELIKLLEFSMARLNSSNDFGELVKDWERKLKTGKVLNPYVPDFIPKLSPSTKEPIAPVVTLATKASPCKKKDPSPTDKSHSDRPVATTLKMEKQPDTDTKPSVSTALSKQLDSVWHTVPRSKRGPHVSAVPAISNMPSASHRSSGAGTLKSSKGVVLKGFPTPNTEKSSVYDSTLPSKTGDKLKDDGRSTKEHKETLSLPRTSKRTGASGTEQHDSSNVLQDLVTPVKPASDTVDLSMTSGLQGSDETSSSKQEIGTPSTSTPTAIDRKTLKTANTSTPNSSSKKKNKKKSKKGQTVTVDDEDEFGSLTPELTVDMSKCVDFYVEMAWRIRNGILAYQKARVKLPGLQGEINEFWRSRSICSLDVERAKLMKMLSSRCVAYEYQGNPELHLVGLLLKDIMFRMDDILTMDLIFLYSKDLKDQFRQNLEVRYLKMVMSVKDWCPESIPPVEFMDLPNEYNIPKKHLEYFVLYLNRQAAQRGIRALPAANNNSWTPLERELQADYSKMQVEHFVWDREQAKEFFRTSIALAPFSLYEKAITNFYIECFKFLLEVNSCIIDYDACWCSTYCEKIDAHDIMETWFGKH